MADRDLIGRDDERARLQERFDRAIAGEGGLVLVAGEGGVGKTRLMDALASSTPAAVLRGGASRDATPAYGPVVAALRSYLRAHP
ncbi:MAG TPA: AAA family ATPase, partial [Solirubrobacterales bacterium]|nr:AAA family ATPase [Solirubrobacterales bacterium]